MLDKMLKTSESAGMEHAERHPVSGVVLTKITPEDESTRFCVELTSHSPSPTPLLPTLTPSAGEQQVSGG